MWKCGDDVKTIKQKLKSNAGASITFALLLFLVCAVVSSVVIAAGTAAAGRMSQLTEMDQRYYAVTSAGELLRDVFDEVDSVVVEYKKPTADEDSKVLNATLVFADNTKSDVVYTSDETGELTPDSIEGLLVAATGKLIVPPDDTSDPVFSNPFSLKLTIDSEDFKDAALDCTINESLGRDGLLTFEVSNVIPEGSTKRMGYTLSIVFKSNIQLIPSDSKATTEAASVKWSLHSVEKNRVSA